MSLGRPRKRIRSDLMAIRHQIMEARSILLRSMRGQVWSKDAEEINHRLTLASDRLMPLERFARLR